MVLLVLAVIVYINMTPTLGKDATNADKIFDFLDKWASAGTPAIMLLAILVALAVGLAGIRETRSIQRNEQKRRLLDEIKKWALDLQSAEVPTIPPISEIMATAQAGALGEKARVALSKAEASLKYASVLFEGSYIRELAQKVFKKELGDTFRTIGSELAAGTYLTSKDAGTPYVVSPSDREIVQKLEENLMSGKKTLEQLLNEHRELLQKQVDELLTKIADVKVKLL